MTVPRQLAQSLSALRKAFESPYLRRIQLAGAGSTIGAWAYGVGLAVYAYDAGGAKTVGLLFAVRWGLSALTAPWLALAADRFSRRQVMIAADLLRVGLLAGMAALAAAGGPSVAVFVLAVGASIASSVFPPAQAALLPALVRTPEELTAANVVMNTVSSVGMFAGPALGGVLLAVSGPWAVFAATAATFSWSAMCLLRIPPDEPPSAAERGSVTRELLAGFHAIARTPALQVVVGLTGLQTLVTGAFEVLVVVLALRLLDAGNAGLGWLNTAMGIGCLLGALVVAALAGRKRLAGDLGIGVLLWGVPLVLAGVWTNFAFALVLLAVVGIGNTLVDVAGMTLLQRSAPDAVVGRVFGVLESIILGGLALGSLVAPAVVAALGARGALIAVGLFLPVVLVPLWARLRAVDASAHVPAEPLELLRAIPMFAPLPAPVLERLAAAAEPVTIEPGAVLFRQGDPGDRFYVIAAGRAAVEIDGGDAATLGPGDFFGEIALLRDMPRTATVRALESLRLYAIDREHFLGAVTGHAPSLEAAHTVVTARLPAAAVL